MNFLVKNYWADLKIIWHKRSSGDPLPRLFKLYISVEKHAIPGHEGPSCFSCRLLTFFNINFFKKLFREPHIRVSNGVDLETECRS